MNILNWRYSVVDGVMYWIIKTGNEIGIYLDSDLETNLLPYLSMELMQRIIKESKSNVL